MSLNPWRSTLITLRNVILMFVNLKIFFEIKNFSPDQCGSVGWLSFHKVKGHWFDFQSGHTAGVWVQSCNWIQVQLSAATKANTPETGADVKVSGLFADAGHMRDGGLTSQSPSPGKMEPSCQKAHLHLSVEAENFIRRQRGTEQTDQGKGLRSSLYRLTSTIHSEKAVDGLLCVILV